MNWKQIRKILYFLIFFGLAVNMIDMQIENYTLNILVDSLVAWLLVFLGAFIVLED